jgi:hypothetical protein
MPGKQANFADSMVQIHGVNQWTHQIGVVHGKGRLPIIAPGGAPEGVARGRIVPLKERADNSFRQGGFLLAITADGGGTLRWIFRLRRG